MIDRTIPAGWNWPSGFLKSRLPITPPTREPPMPSNVVIQNPSAEIVNVRVRAIVATRREAAPVQRRPTSAGDAGRGVPYDMWFDTPDGARALPCEAISAAEASAD